MKSVPVSLRTLEHRVMRLAATDRVLRTNRWSLCVVAVCSLTSTAFAQEPTPADADPADPKTELAQEPAPAVIDPAVIHFPQPTTVYAGRDFQSAPLFVVVAEAPLRVEATFGDWLRVTDEHGNSGWIPKTGLAPISPDVDRLEHKPPQDVESPRSSRKNAGEPNTIWRRCGLGLYMEPSLMFTVASATQEPSPRPGDIAPHIDVDNDAKLWGRLAAGGAKRFCEDGVMGTQVRLGATAYLTRLDWGGHTEYDHNTWKVGIGVEVEVDRPVSRRLRIGARMGVENSWDGFDPGRMHTIGARLHISSGGWVGVDLFKSMPPGAGLFDGSCHQTAFDGCLSSTTGITAGFGVQDLPGVVVSGVVGGIATLFFWGLILAAGPG